MRWRLVVPLAVAVATTAGATYVVVDRADSRSPSESAVATPGLTRSSVLPSLGESVASPTKAAVRAALAPALASFPTGEVTNGRVVDVGSGATLWARGAQTPVAPASTLKILTAAAALKALGADYRFTTKTRAAGNTVYLVGGGDPTLARSAGADHRPVAYPAPANLADLAARTAAALAPGQTVRLRADSSAWSSPTLAEGWNDGYVAEGNVTPPSALELNGGRLRPAEFDSPRTTDPVGQTAEVFASLLRKQGVVVKDDIEEATAPETSRELATVTSPPLGALITRLLTNSDNDLAEAIGRAIAVHAGQPPTFAAAAAAVTSEVAALGVPADQVDLYDTSGLSHQDLLTPAALVTVLRTAARDPVLRPLIDGLPVGGFTGTLADRYRGTNEGAGTGLVRAKTGSLVGVNALAGVVVDGSGRLLAFAFLSSGTFETEAVQTSLDRMASALAGLT